MTQPHPLLDRLVALHGTEKAPPRYGLWPCRCGCYTGRLVEGTAGHPLRMRCASCTRHLGWLDPETLKALAKNGHLRPKVTE